MIYNTVARIGLRGIRKPVISLPYSEQNFFPRSLTRLEVPTTLRTPPKLVNTFSTLTCLRNEHKHSHSHDSKTSSGESATTNTHSHNHSSNEHTHSHSLFSHSHSHSAADNIFLKERGGLRNPAIRITWIGLLTNLAMVVGKGVGGIVFHSQSLLADAIHAISDLVSDFLTLATVSVASSPPSKYFPNGYGKIETLGALGVSALLLLAGVSVGWSGLISLTQQLFGDSHIVQFFVSVFGHGHSHSHNDTKTEMVDLNAMWLALASIGVKEWLFRATMKVAHQTGSTALVANAWHHRVDSLTSMVAVCTIGGSYLLDLAWLDAFGGLLVSSVIIRAGFKNSKAAALELADSTSSVDKNQVDIQREHVQSLLIQHAAESNGHIQSTDFTVDDLILLPSGPNILAEIKLGLHRPSLPTASAVAMTAYVERELLKQNPRVKRAIVTVVTDNKPQN